MIPKGPIVVALIAGVLLPSMGVADDPQPLQRRPSFRHVELPADFLTDGSVSVEQDSTGFLWVGGPSGLFRYDGYRLHKLARDKDPGGGRCESVYDLEVDDKSLWLATRCGIERFSLEYETTERFSLPVDDGPSPHAYRLRRDHGRAQLWIGSADGLFHLPLSADGLPTGSPERTSELPEELHLLAVRAIWLDEDGGVWIGTKKGIYRLAPKGDRFLREVFAPPVDETEAQEIEAILRDSQGTLWATTHFGLRRRSADDERWWPADEPAELCDFSPHQWFYGLTEDHAGVLWISSGGNIIRWRPGDPRAECHSRFSQEADGLGGVVDRLHTDTSGTVWLSTNRSLARFDDRQVQAWKYRLGEAVSEYTWTTSWSVSPFWDADGYLWVGSNLGIFQIDTDRRLLVAHFMEDDPRLLTTIDRSTVGDLPSFTVFALAGGSDGAIWAGTTAGLARLPSGGEKFEHVTLDGLPGVDPRPRIQSLIAGDGDLWIGTAQGVVRLALQDRKAELLQISPQIAQDIERIRGGSLVRHPDGRLWVGTEDRGLLISPDGRQPLAHLGGAWESDLDPAHDDLLRHGYVTTLYLEPEHPDSGAPGTTLWVSFGSGEVLELDLERQEVRSPPWADELGPRALRSLLLVGTDLWLVSGHGLSRVDRASGEIRHLGRQDGLFEPMSLFDITRRDDRLFITGSSLLELPLELDEPSAPVPRVRLTDLRLFNQRARPRAVDPSSPLERRLPFVDQLELGPDQPVVTFEISALGSPHPERLRYFHLLEGAQDRWLENRAAAPFITFSDLNPGRYLLRVRAVRDGQLPEDAAATEARLHLNVRPHWWASGWAKALYLLAALGLLAIWARTQRAEAERQRQLNRRLERLDRLKDEFLANTSHELRTPIFAMSGLAETLLDSAESPTTGLRSKLRLIVASGRRLSTLLTDTLDFSQLREEPLPLQQQALDMRQAVREAVELCLPLEEPSKHADSGLAAPTFVVDGVTVSNEVPPDLPPAFVDPVRARQILTHLVGNALKFTTEGSVRIRGEIAQDPSFLRLEVHDTGLGLTEGELERVFRPFEQLHGGSTRRQGGTGLGLALARRLVELHGGRLEAESRPAVGSVFSLILPRAEPSTRSERELSSVRALVVDDDPINLTILETYLESAGHHVTTAASGREALELVAAQTFDVVLLDVMMPEMSGFEVCRRLRSDPEHDSMSIFFVSAKSAPEDLHRGLDLGADAYLTKPIDQSNLNRALASHLRPLQADD